MLWDSLQCVIWVFPDHTHLPFSERPGEEHLIEIIWNLGEQMSFGDISHFKLWWSFLFGEQFG